MEKRKIIAVSGGFDPLHAGHLRMFQDAKATGTYLVVILNNDNWLREKKGYAFMPEQQRMEIIKAIGCVDQVYLTKHEPDPKDMSVCSELSLLGVNVFANGGDRKEDNVPEVDLCKRMGIEMAWGVGGAKIESSSELVNRAMNAIIKNETHALAEAQKIEIRPWGSFTVLAQRKEWWVKIIDIAPGGVLSLQKHANRDEMWMIVEGQAEAYSDKGLVKKLKVGDSPVGVKRGHWHRLLSTTGAKLIEVAIGEPTEEDIERSQDIYGRI